MGFSAPWSDSIDIIDLYLYEKCLGINPIGLSAPWADTRDIVSFQTAKING